MGQVRETDKSMCKDQSGRYNHIFVRGTLDLDFFFCLVIAVDIVSYHFILICLVWFKAMGLEYSVIIISMNNGEVIN